MHFLFTDFYVKKLLKCTLSHLSYAKVSSSVIVTITLQENVRLISLWEKMGSVFPGSDSSPKIHRHIAMTHLIISRDEFLFQFSFHSLPEACNSHDIFKWVRVQWDFSWKSQEVICVRRTSRFPSLPSQVHCSVPAVSLSFLSFETFQKL